MQLTDKQKGIGLALFGVLLITPDSLFVRLITANSWELIFYRGLIPFVCLLIALLFFYKKKFYSCLLHHRFSWSIKCYLDGIRQYNVCYFTREY